MIKNSYQNRKGKFVNMFCIVHCGFHVRCVVLCKAVLEEVHVQLAGLVTGCFSVSIGCNCLF